MDIALPLQQHPHFGAALARFGRTVRFVDVAGAVPVLAVRQFGQLMASRGPVWLEAPHAMALRGAGLRLINADVPQDDLLRRAGFRRLMTDAHVAELDLTGTSEARQYAMKPKWRAAWQMAQDTPMDCRWQQYDRQIHAWLLRADLAQQHRKRFRGLPHTLIDACAAGQPGAVQVLVALEKDTPVAGMLFLLHAPVATYHIGWTSARGRQLSAHHHMIMIAADYLAISGFRRLDLGLLETDTAPGLARFKIGTGARVRSLGGTWLRLPGC